MALTENENKIDGTMELIPRAGFTPGYVNIMRGMMDFQGNYSVEYRRYASQVDRDAHPEETPGLIGIGGRASKAERDIIFKILYLRSEAEFHVQALMVVFQKDLGALKTERKTLEAARTEEFQAITEEEPVKLKALQNAVIEKYIPLFDAITTGEDLKKEFDLKKTEIYATMGIDEV